MNLVEKLLSFKFRSGYDADHEDNEDSTNLEVLEKLFKIKAMEHYSYFDTFYNTLKTMKMLDTEYTKNKSLEKYIENMEELMSNFMNEIDNYDTILSFNDIMSDDYSTIRNFGFKIIDTLKHKYKKRKEETVKSEEPVEHEVKRQRT